MHELEQAICADAGFLGEALTVDLERSAMKKLVGVTDADGAKTPHVVAGDSIEVLERAVQRSKDKARV